jgi:hypothetical protein
MRFLSRDTESVTFELDRRELELLTFLLRRYPVRDPAYPQLASPNEREALADEQRMLTESLTAEQEENRGKVAEFIRTRLTPPASTPPGSSGSAPFEFSVRISFAEVDWLLRVINDVRVGCWVRLGCPEEQSLHLPPLSFSLSKVTDFAAMELGGVVLGVLLEALEN